jgi:hypothetical protein
MNQTWSPWNDEIPSRDVNLLGTPQVGLSREAVEYEEETEYVSHMRLGSPRGVASEDKGGYESRSQLRMRLSGLGTVITVGVSDPLKSRSIFLQKTRQKGGEPPHRARSIRNLPPTQKERTMHRKAL